MGLFDIFRQSDSVIKDKIIVTQKGRINALESDIGDLKNLINRKDGELREVRTNFDRSKERLIDQVVELSDKFAGIQQDIMAVAHENGKLKASITFKPEKKSSSSKKKKEKRKR